MPLSALYSRLRSLRLRMMTRRGGSCSAVLVCCVQTASSRVPMVAQAGWASRRVRPLRLTVPCCPRSCPGGSSLPLSSAWPGTAMTDLRVPLIVAAMASISGRDRLDVDPFGLEVASCPIISTCLLRTDDSALVRAAVLVLEPVVGLGRSALVVLVPIRSLSLSGIGASVLVLEARPCPPYLRGNALTSRMPSLSLSGSGAAVLVLEAVLSSGIVGALVDVVGDAVTVARTW